MPRNNLADWINKRTPCTVILLNTQDYDIIAKLHFWLYTFLKKTSKEPVFQAANPWETEPQETLS